MRPAFVLKIAGLILWRSWRATVVLTLMVISAVAALVFLSALAVGTNDAMIRNSTGLFAGHIVGSQLREKDPSLLVLPGVERVLIRRQQPVLLARGEILEPMVLTGVDPDQEQAGTALSQKTVAGRYLRPGEATIFLGQESARRLQAGVGDRVEVRNRRGEPLTTLEVVGIFKTGLTHLDQGLAFCPQSALPAGEAEISIAAFLEAGAPLDALVSRYRLLLPTATFAAWTEFMPDLKQLIDLDALCMAIIITLVFAIVSVGISCAFLIFSLKNLREHGIMKAMGLQSSDTALLLLAQIGLLTLAAAILGTLAGVVTVAVFARIGIDISTFTSHNQYFAVSGMLYPRLTGLAVCTPPLSAIVFGLIAAVWPIVSIIGKTPAEILRSV